MSIPKHPYRPLIERACAEVGTVPPDVLESMVWVESNFVPSARSKSDALGLCQIIYRWHGSLTDRIALSLGKQPGHLALFDPEVNLRVAATHLRWCYSECKTWEGAVRKFHSGSCNPPSGFEDGQGTTSDQHIIKFRSALHDVQAARQEPSTMKAHKAVGLSKPLYLPDDIPFEARIIPASHGNVRSSQKRSAASVTRTTRHETANFNAGANAEMHYRYLMSNPSPAAGYNTVSDDKKVIQLTPFDEVTWAAGTPAGNATSDHHELCVNSDINHARARYIASRVDAAVLHARDLPISALVQHNFWTGKNCPMLLRQNNLWGWYVGEVTKALNAIKAHIGVGTVDPVPPPVAYAEPITIPGLAELAAFAKEVGLAITAVNYQVKAIRETPRYQSPAGKLVGPPIKAGQVFDIMAEYKDAKGKGWYITPFWTRVKAEDVERVT